MKPRSGLAIVIVLVVLLLIEAMAAGMLALATHARAAADAQLRSTRAAVAAQLAARVTIREWEVARADTLQVGAVRSFARGGGAEADASWSAAIERLPSQFVVRSQGYVGSAVVYSKANSFALARMLDRSAVLGELDAALQSGGVLVLDGAALALDHDSACAAPPPPLQPAAAISAAPALVAPAATVTGTILTDSLLRWSDSTALGNASWSDVAAIADRIEVGVLTPSPVVNGNACDTTALANWGEPAAGTPCSSYAPLVYAPGDLTVAGGRGQGILVVDGVVALRGNAHFSGAVLARTGVTIDGGAMVKGAVLARRGFVLLQDATALYSHCELQRVLAATRAGRRLLPQWRRFLPVF
jgi:hypothetical protein